MKQNKLKSNSIICDKDMWRMPSILDDPGKIIIMAGEWKMNYQLCYAFNKR